MSTFNARLTFMSEATCGILLLDLDFALFTPRNVVFVVLVSRRISRDPSLAALSPLRSLKLKKSAASIFTKGRQQSSMYPGAVISRKTLNLSGVQD